MYICIPSKGRSNFFKTLGLLKGYDKDRILVFVEPKETEDYSNLHEDFCTIVDILKDNQGIAYSRNFILKYMKSRTDYFWMMDDDVTEIRERKDELIKKEKSEYWAMKCLKGDDILDALVLCHEDFKKNYHDYVQYGIPFTRDNHFYPELKYKSPDRVWACGMVNMDMVQELGLSYDPNCATFDDYDFIASYLIQGGKNVTNYKYGFDNVRMATNKSGGLVDVYKDKDRTKSLCHYLVHKYGVDFVKVVYKPKKKFWQPVFKWRELKKLETKQVNLIGYT